MIQPVRTSDNEMSLTEQVNTPPSAIEAERLLLGGLMLDTHSWEHIAGKVNALDFYRPDHRLIFAAIRELADKDQPCDAVTLSEYLNSHGKLADAGGLAYLGSLTKESPSAANVVSYANIIRERSVMRDLIEIGNDIAKSGLIPEGRSGKELVDDAERRIFEIAEKGARGKTGFKPLVDLCGGLMDELDKRHRQGEEITGLPTGYKKFDAITQGLHEGDLIIVAGRPSMGKTTLALNIAEYAAFNPKDPKGVAVFSMEMGAEQLALRFVSSLGQVSQGHLRNGKFSHNDWPNISSAIKQMSQAPLYIDDTPSLTPTDVRARARRLKRQHDIGLIVVDYLQLMQTGGSVENRATEISEISRSLKSLARELRIPVIVISQLNRSVEQRPDKGPVMSDLRESGAIEQDADLILFIYRDEVYNEETARKGQADILIAKHRNGEIGSFVLTFRGQFSRFENYSPEFPLPAEGSYGPPEGGLS
jgi:replicative DNA helicase